VDWNLLETAGFDFWGTPSEPRATRDPLWWAPQCVTEPVAVKLPAAFVGELRDPTIHFDAVAANESDLVRDFKELSSYVNEIDPVEETNLGLLRYVADLREILELVGSSPRNAGL